MSERIVDRNGRWRNKTVAFRMSPAEACELDDKVKLSGLTKQEYLIRACLDHRVKVVCSIKVVRQMQEYLEAILFELQSLREGSEPSEEMLGILKSILVILGGAEADRR